MNYAFSLELITPVIINNGESFEFCEIYPTETLAKKELNSDIDIPDSFKFIQNRIDKLFDNLSASEIKNFINRSSTALIQGDNESLADLRRGLMLKCGKDSIRVPGRILPLAKKELSRKPMQKVDKIFQEELSGRAYIPGSSVKGAIRTAILEYLRKVKEIEYCNSKSREFEAKLLFNEEKFDINGDPFKYIKVSDFQLKGIAGMQYIAKIGDDGKMPIYSAMTSSYALYGKPVVAEGSVSIDDNFYKKLNIKNGISGLLEILDDFYIEEVWNKPNMRDAINSSSLMRKLKNKINEMRNDDYHMLRLGHYIGIQNYTFKIDQNPPPRGAKRDINKTGGRIVKIEGGVIPGVCMLKVKEVD